MSVIRGGANWSVNFGPMTTREINKMAEKPTMEREPASPPKRGSSILQLMRKPTPGIVKWMADRASLKSSTQNALLGIDAQHDFVTPGKGTLVVGGADMDTDRIADDIRNSKGEIRNVYFTLDTHNPTHIGNAANWAKPSEENPETLETLTPFQTINPQDVIDGKIRPSEEMLNKKFGEGYTPEQEAQLTNELKQAAQKYLDSGKSIDLWPAHCEVDTEGHAIPDKLTQALAEFTQRGGKVYFFFKGMNDKTEQYSAVKALVPQPDDPRTGENRKLLDKLEKTVSSGGEISVFGQALTHCVKGTIEEIVESRPATAPGMALLSDRTSPVVLPGQDAGEERSGAEAAIRALGVKIEARDRA